MAARTLVNMQPLPPRAKVLDSAQVEADIREAMALCERKLYDRATRYTQSGYTWGEPTFDIASHTVVGKLRLERPD